MLETNQENHLTVVGLLATRCPHHDGVWNWRPRFLVEIWIPHLWYLSGPVSDAAQAAIHLRPLVPTSFTAPKSWLTHGSALEFWSPTKWILFKPSRICIPRKANQSQNHLKTCKICELLSICWSVTVSFKPVPSTTSLCSCIFIPPISD